LFIYNWNGYKQEKSTSGSRIHIELAVSQALENQIILIFSGTSKSP